MSIAFVLAQPFAQHAMLAARLAGPLLRDRRQHHRENHHAQPYGRAYPRYEPAPTGTIAATATPQGDGRPGQLDKRVPSGLGWPCGPVGRPGTPGLPAGNAQPSRNEETSL